MNFQSMILGCVASFFFCLFLFAQTAFCAGDYYEIRLRDGSVIAADDYYEENGMLVYEKYSASIRIPMAKVSSVALVEKTVEQNVVQHKEKNEPEETQYYRYNNRQQLTVKQKRELRKQLHDLNLELRKLKARGASAFEKEAARLNRRRLSSGKSPTTSSKILKRKIQQIEAQIETLKYYVK